MGRPSAFAAGGTWRPHAEMAADAPTRLLEEARSGQLGRGAVAILWLYVPGIWEGAKACGLHPAQRPGLTGVAAMNGLAAALCIFDQNAAIAS